MQVTSTAAEPVPAAPPLAGLGLADPSLFGLGLAEPPLPRCNASVRSAAANVTVLLEVTVTGAARPGAMSERLPVTGSAWSVAVRPRQWVIVVVRWLAATDKSIVELTVDDPLWRKAPTAVGGSRSVIRTPPGWMRWPAVAVRGNAAATVTSTSCVPVGNGHA